MSEQEQFLKDIGTDQNREVDVLDKPFVEDPEKGEDKKDDQTTTEDKHEDEEGDEQDLKPRNRRERRLMKRYQEERESSIFMAGKMQAQTEARTALTEEADYLKSIERIYGTDTVEAQLATDLLKKAITGARDDAKAQALAEYRAEREQEAKADAEAEDELDGFVDEIEQEYNVRLNPAQERAYFQIMMRMSPKDRQGRVVEYADPHAVWEVYQERANRAKTGTGNRAKELSARSMTQSGASAESTLKDDSATRFLKDNGII